MEQHYVLRFPKDYYTQGFMQFLKDQGHLVLNTMDTDIPLMTTMAKHHHQSVFPEGIWDDARANGFMEKIRKQFRVLSSAQRIELRIRYKETDTTEREKKRQEYFDRAKENALETHRRGTSKTSGMLASVGLFEGK